MNLTNLQILQDKLLPALAARSAMLDEEHTGALRLFNGFYEGYPGLGVDLYGCTLVLFSYTPSSPASQAALNMAQEILLGALPWIDTVIQKKREQRDSPARRGILTFGAHPARQISEFGVRYALDLQLNQDASFYLDTRYLRQWLLENAEGWHVLNAFAYTGSLGIAALAGGAALVVQSDRSRKFLALARQSARLNRFDLSKMKTGAVDFFRQVAQFKQSNQLFDAVLVDPPFFSTTAGGTIDLANQSKRVINKVRPLIRDSGTLIAINNALFLSGAQYLQSLEDLCADGYLSIEELITVPPDMTGFPQTIVNSPPSDPAPFNHPTKIAVLRVRRR